MEVGKAVFASVHGQAQFSEGNDLEQSAKRPGVNAGSSWCEPRMTRAVDLFLDEKRAVGPVVENYNPGDWGEVNFEATGAGTC